MSYTFHAQRDNAAGTLLYPFSPGDPTLRLNSGQGSPFGPVSSTTPIRVTVYHPASLVGGAVVDPTMTATFNVVSLAGDNLGGLTFQRGNSTLVFPVGSTVARVITQDDFAEIQTAVNDLAESGTAGVSISSPNGTLAVGGTASLPTLDVLAVPQSAVTGLTAALAGKLGTTGDGSALTGLTQSQIAGLTSALAGKLATNGDGSALTGLTQSQISGLVAALADKLSTTGDGSALTGLTQSQIAGLTSALAGKLATNGDGSALTGLTQSQISGLVAALADKLSTTGDGSGLTGITQSQIGGLHSDQSPTFAGATFTGAPSAPSFTLSGTTAASSFGSAVLAGRSVPVINADGSVNVAAFDSAGMTINGSSRPNVIGAALSVTPVSPSHVGLTVNGAPSQTADLQRWKSGVGAAVASVLNDGTISTASNIILAGTAAYLRNNSGSVYFGASDDSRLYRIAANYLGTPGSLSVGSSAAAGVGLAVTASNSGHVGAIVKGAPSQSANLQEWQDSNGNVYAAIRSADSLRGHLLLSAPAGQGGGSGIDLYSNDNANSALFQLDGYGNLVLRNASDGSTYFDFSNSAYFRSVTSGSATTVQLNASGAPALVVTPSAATDVGLAVQAAVSQSANLQEWRNSSGTVLSAITSGGALKLVTLADSAAPNGSVYFGSDHLDGNSAPKLCRKDASGNVNVIG